MGRIACILGLLVVCTGFGSATYTNAVSENEWKVESSVFECRLVYPFPFFGEAVFSTRAGERSAFYLNARSARFQAGQAKVSTRTPIWKPDTLTEELGFITVKRGKQAVGLDTRWTEMIMARLHAGREVEISSPLWFEEGRGFEEGRRYEEGQEGKPLTLVMSAVGFRPAYKKYLGCLTSLLPSNFEQMKRTALYFPSDVADEIPPIEADKLDRILKIVKHDRSVRSFFVDGHTDGTGDRTSNLAISKNRAQLVAQYLMRRGVPGDWITVRWHGERYPVASNNTEKGRASNRRVTVRLERVEEIEVLPLAYN